MRPRIPSLLEIVLNGFFAVYLALPSGLIAEGPSVAGQRLVKAQAELANTVPLIGIITNQTINIGQTFGALLRATDTDAPPQHLSFSLLQSPTGAVLRSLRETNVLLRWTPSRSAAKTTNSFTVTVTDDGVPNLSATQSFDVVVTEFVQAGLGTLVLQAGEDGCLPIKLDSTEAITNISFVVSWVPGTLTNFAIQPQLSSICASNVQFLSSGQARVNLSVCPGQSVALTQAVEIADLCFTAVAGQASGFVPLRIGDTIVTRIDGSSATNVSPGVGRTVVVGEKPMLEAVITGENQRRLFLYGRPGAVYQVESTTNVSGAPWELACRVPMTGPSIVVCCADLGTNTIYYRAFRYSDGPTNQIPVVNAGPDQVVHIPQASLQGVATDDGLPAACQPLTYRWTNLIGPGAVSFSSATSLITTAIFSQPGTYVLRLMVSDSQDIGIDDATVTVLPPPCIGGETAGWRGVVTAFSAFRSGQSGSVVFTNCQAIMTEGDSFMVAAERTVTVPTNAGTFYVSYAWPSFDTSTTNQMRDAFEAALVDLAGRPLTLTIQGQSGATPSSSDVPAVLPANPDAFFNHSEGRSPFVAPGATMQDNFPNLGTHLLRVNVSQLKPGSTAKIILRLVNNDGDQDTQVRILNAGFEPITGEINSGFSAGTALSLLPSLSGGNATQMQANNSDCAMLLNFQRSSDFSPKVVNGTSSLASSNDTLAVFNDKSLFLGRTRAADLTGELPNLGLIPDGPSAMQKIGHVTFSIAAPSTELYIGTDGPDPSDWTALLPGPDIAISGMENLNAEFETEVYSVGFDFVEPSTDDFGCPYIDSTFSVTLKHDSEMVGTFDFNAPSDTAHFIGVLSARSFNRMEIRETGGGCDDEFFGHFYGGAFPVTFLGSPTLIITSPKHNSDAPAGTALMSGSAISSIVVSVNGTPVDALDEAGNFFATVGVKPGQNVFEVVATDSRGRSTTNSVTVNGTTCPENFSSLGEVSTDVETEYGRTSFSEWTKVLYADVALRNSSSVPVRAPFYVGVTGISDPNVHLLSPDGVSADGIPYYNFSATLTNGILRPTGMGASEAFEARLEFAVNSNVLVLSWPAGLTNGVIEETSMQDHPRPAWNEFFTITAATNRLVIPMLGQSRAFRIHVRQPASLSRTLAFHNPSYVPFTYDLVVLGQRNQAPSFTSAPIVQAIQGRPYVYHFSAIDPDGDALTYSILSDPVGMVLNAELSTLSFQPSTNQVGNHDISLRADDGHGGVTEQHYLLSIINPPSNRPPYFVSTPVTMARVTTNSACHQPPPGLVAWWPGDGNARDLLFGNDGVLQAEAGFASGLVDQAFRFDGQSNEVVVPHSPVHDLRSALTIEAWVFRKGSANGNEIVLMKRTEGTGCEEPYRYGLLIYNREQSNVGSAVFSLNTGTWTDAVVSTSTIPVNVWTHLAGTFDGINAKIYVNGVSERSVSLPGSILPSTNGVIEIGHHPSYGPGTCIEEAFHGMIDELALYNRALSSNEIAEIYAAAGAGRCKPAPQLLRNPSFEFALTPAIGQGVLPDDWFDFSDVSPGADTFSNDGSFGVSPGTSSQFVGATAAVGLRWVAGARFANASFEGLRQPLRIPLQPGLTYSVSAFLRLTTLPEDGFPGGYDVLLSGSNRAEDVASAVLLGKLSETTSATDWQLREINFVAPSNSAALTNIILRPYSSVEGQTAYVGLDSLFLREQSNGNPSIACASCISSYFYRVVATDADSDPLNYFLVTAPSGMTIDEVDGFIRWEPTSDQVGTHDVTVRAEDGRGGIAYQTYRICVLPIEGNRPPVILSLPLSNALPGSCYAVQAIDPDGDRLNYTLLQGPPGMTINSSNGILQWLWLGTNRVSFDEPGLVAGEGPDPYFSGTFKGTVLSNQLVASGITFTTSSNGVAYVSDITITGSEPSPSGRNLFAVNTLEANGPPATLTATFVVPQSGEPGTIEGSSFSVFVADANSTPTPRILVRSFDAVHGLLEERQLNSDSELIHFTRGRIATVEFIDLGGDGHVIDDLSFGPVTPLHSQTSVRVSDGRGGFDEQTFEIDASTAFTGAIKGVVFDDRNADGAFAPARTVELKFDSLPSAQGWFYEVVGNDASESTIFSTDGTTLFQNSLGMPFVSGGNRYIYSDIPDPLLPFTWEVRAKVLVEELGGADPLNHFGFEFHLHDGTDFFYLGLGTGAAIGSGYTMLDTAVDLTQFHDYRLERTTGTAYRIFIDDQLVDAGLSFNPNPPGPYPIGIHLGDGTGGVNARAEVTRSVFTQHGGDKEKPSTTVYLDLNNDGRRDACEPFVNTDTNGAYVFSGLAPGVYPVRVEVPPGWRQTAPSNWFYHITSTNGQVVSNADFGMVQDINAGPNHAPVFVSLPSSVEITANQTYRYDVYALDTDDDSLAFDLVKRPEGMVVMTSTGVIVWRPTLSQLGIHDIILRVQDDHGGAALQSWQITVIAPNSPPVITSIPPAPAVVNVPYHYVARAQDQEAQPVMFSLTNTIAAAHFVPDFSNAQSAVLSWTPSIADLGSNHLEIVARDSGGAETRQAFDLEVLVSAINRPPVIISSPRTQARLNLAYAYEISAADPDGDALNIDLFSGPAGMVLTNSQPLRFNSRLLVWNPDQLGSNSVIVQVSDGRGGVAQQQFGINVIATLSNQPPLIVSTPQIHATVGQLYQYDLVAADPDGDVVAWRLLSGPHGLSLDSGTGMIRWNPTLDQLGSNLVVVAAQDPFLAGDTQTFIIEVDCLNRSPQITSTPPVGANVGQSYLYAVRGQDADGDALTFSFVATNEIPSGMTISNLVSSTGSGFGGALIRWTPSTNEAGTYLIRLRVRDGRGGEGEQSYQLHAVDENANRAPLITSRAPQGAAIAQPFSYTLRAADADNDALTLELLSGPSGATFSTSLAVDGAAEGLLQWTPTAVQIGLREFILTARDNQGASAVQRFVVNVRSNQIPVISSTPGTQAVLYATYRYDVRAIDPEGDTLSYALVQAPAGLSIDAAGRIRWSPSIEQFGSNLVTLSAADAFGGQAVQSFVVHVAPDIQPPVVGLTVNYNLQDGAGNRYIRVGTQAGLRVTATDNVGVAGLNLWLDGVPIPLAGDGSATASFTSPGLVQAIASATDASGNTTSITNTIQVIDPNAGSTVAIEIHNPTNMAELTRPADVLATITSDVPLRNYVLEYAELTQEAGEVDVNLAHPSLVYHSITNATLPPGLRGLTNRVLGRFDPTMLQNGGYAVRVTAFDINGQGQQEGVIVIVSGNLKFGEFRVAFTDLQIPVAGIPITIQRVYDSRDAQRRGDFGHGWTLGVQDARILEIGKKPFYGFGDDSTTFSTRTRVFLTTPDGRRVGFRFTPEVAGVGLILGAFYRPSFTGDPGVYDKLESLPSDGGYQIEPDGSFTGGFGLVGYDPTGYRLTTKEGTVYEYDQDFGLQRITDPNGNALAFHQDNIQHTSAGSGAVDQQITFVRDALGRITQIVDPNGHALRYAYDTAGDLRSFTDQVSNVARYAYSTVRPHYLTNIIDALGHPALNLEYDAAGRLTTMRDAGGNPVSQDFNSDLQIGTFTDGNGNVTQLRFDDRGNETERALAGVSTNHFAYDANDNLLASTNGRGFSTNYLYDARGNVTSITDSLGHRTTIAYNDQNKPAGVTNALGQILNLRYDTAGKLVEVINNAGFSTTVARDAQGRAAALTDAAGHTTIFDYTGGCPCGRPSKVINPDGSFRLYEYDVFGQTNRVVNELGAETVFQHDDYGRLVWMRDPLTNYTHFKYNGPLLTNVVDALGRSTRYEYDAKNRTNAIIDAQGGVVRFEYDQNGNRTKVIDAVSNVTTFVYNAGNRLAQQIDPLGHTNFFGYDAAGNRTEAIDRNGRRRTFAYDAANRMTNELWWQGPNILRSIVFGFNELGVQTLAADPAARYEYNYDTLNRLERVLAQSAGVPDFTLLYIYTALGQVESVTDNWGARVSSSYDNRNRLASRAWSSTLPGAGVDPARVDFAYDVSGNRVRTDRFADLGGANRIGSTTNAYNRAGIVKNITHLGPASEVLAKYDYNFDAAFQITRWTINNQRSDFSYDRTGQLTNALNTAQPDENFRYDANGNRVGVQSSGSYVVGGNNQVLFDGTNRYAYDAEGSMISRSNTVTSVLTAYQWDHRNRLLSVLDHNPGGVVTQTVAFMYDAMNRRLAKTVNGQTTRFLYNGDDSWADLDASNAVTARYLHGAQIDELLARHRASDGRDWYLADHLGTVRDIANAAGVVVAHVDFSSFGQVLSVSNSEAADRFLFAGREFDGETELCFYRARYYSASMGRFITTDPLRFASWDFNLYRYVHNNANAASDPTGMIELLERVQIEGENIGKWYASTAQIGGETVVDLVFVEIEGPALAALDYAEGSLAREIAVTQARGIIRGFLKNLPSEYLKKYGTVGLKSMLRTITNDSGFVELLFRGIGTL